MHGDYGLFIGDRWRSRWDGGVLDIVDPATGDLIGWASSASQTAPGSGD